MTLSDPPVIGVMYGASMRPRHEASDDHQAALPAFGPRRRFNEAEARSLG